MDTVLQNIQTARRIIDEAEALLIVAGAGMGVDSGLPDYRGSTGLYKDYPPFAKLGKDYVEMMKLGGFERDPRQAWGFWGYLLGLVRTTEPHDGFRMLLKMGRKLNGNYFVQTTNIDGHFQKAGFDPLRIHECHGSLHRLQCMHPCHEAVWPADPFAATLDPATMLLESPLPKCPECRDVARPNVFMFGDTKYIWDAPKGHADRYQAWLAANHGRRMAIVECGAGTVVRGLRLHSEDLAREYPQAALIRINPFEAEKPNARNCVSISLGALEALSLISENANY